MAEAPQDSTPPKPEAGESNEAPGEQDMSLASLMSHDAPKVGRPKSEKKLRDMRRCAELRRGGVLSIKECMRLFDVSDETVRRWCREAEGDRS